MRSRLLAVALLLAGSFLAASVAAMEIGDDDFRINDLLGNPSRQPAIAYNPSADEYLVVFVGSLEQIRASRIDAATGALLGTEIVVSDWPNQTIFDATDPVVAYNAVDDEYLVVWAGVDDTFYQAGTDELSEILGQRLDASGNEIGADDFRISDMMTGAALDSPAIRPAVVHNPVANEYLVVWDGRDDVTGDREWEVYGQRLDAGGIEVGGDDFRISQAGPETSQQYVAWEAAVAHNGLANEYLVVWSGEDDGGGHVDNEFEIRGQRLDASGTEIGTNDFTLSQAGLLGNSGFDAVTPDVAHNPSRDEYAVVFSATGVGSVGRFEIYLQRLAANGAEVGPNEIAITDVSMGNTTLYGAEVPAITYDASTGGYFVAYRGRDDALMPRQWEIYGQQLGPLGGEVGDSDFRLSALDGEPDSVSAACRGSTGECLAAFQGEDNQLPQPHNNDLHVFGQRMQLVATPIPALGPGAVPILGALIVLIAATLRRA